MVDLVVAMVLFFSSFWGWRGRTRRDHLHNCLLSCRDGRIFINDPSSSGTTKEDQRVNARLQSSSRHEHRFGHYRKKDGFNGDVRVMDNSITTLEASGRDAATVKRTCFRSRASSPAPEHQRNRRVEEMLDADEGQMSRWADGHASATNN
jgi:hypothetical protein